MTITTDVEVQLDDFDEDDIIEYLEDQGYYVTKCVSKTSEVVLITPSYDNQMNSIEHIKDILQKHCYDSSFMRLLLEEITMMPMGSDVDAVLTKLKEMCV